MSMQATHRFNVEEYYRMGECGVIAPDARVELIEGKVIDMMPIGSFHSGALTYLTDCFASAARGRWATSVQNPLRIDEFSEPLPDLMLLRRSPTYYKDRHPKPPDVFLLIETADSSLEKDRERKLPLYARAGIVEYWIVNLPERKLEVYREPNFTGYGSAREITEGECSPAAFPDAVISLDELFRR